jgi:hypothetical protein
MTLDQEIDKSNTRARTSTDKTPTGDAKDNALGASLLAAPERE